jgi:hypothetical protein
MLARRAGEKPTALGVAGVTAETWARVAACLVPVIGMRGFDVLFRRALQQTSRAYPWLEPVAHDSDVAPLENLRARIAEGTTTSASEASYALLVSFTELLSSLIGDSLTERLLGQVSAPRLPASQQETGS